MTAIRFNAGGVCVQPPGPVARGALVWHCLGEVLEPGRFDPSHGYPAVVPYVRYADPVAAIAWLTEVLDAAELLRMPLPDGRVGHAELSVGDSVISLGLASTPRVIEPPTRSTLGAMTLVFVDDVDVRAERAVAAGGHLIDPPTTQPWGLRQAIVADPEMHLWELSRHLHDVSPQSWGAEVPGR